MCCLSLLCWSLIPPFHQDEPCASSGLVLEPDRSWFNSQTLTESVFFSTSWRATGGSRHFFTWSLLQLAPVLFNFFKLLLIWLTVWLYPAAAKHRLCSRCTVHFYVYFSPLRKTKLQGGSSLFHGPQLTTVLLLALCIIFKMWCRRFLF